MDALTTLTVIIGAWFTFYFVIKLFKIKSDNLELSPIYALYKSTGLNGLISRIAMVAPRLWRIAGNIGIAMGLGQAVFATWILVNNLILFFINPSEAESVQPLIPGVTISSSTLPWFMLAAGVVILTHELSHGVQCVIENIKVKSSAILVAVITFGAAVEPDEEQFKKAPLISRLRVFSGGSFVNVVTGILSILLLIFFNHIMPAPFVIFLYWLYLVSINLAMINMLPIGPLDGGQVFRALTEHMKRGKLLQDATTYGFIALILANMVFSFSTFGIIPL